MFIDNILKKIEVTEGSRKTLLKGTTGFISLKLGSGPSINSVTNEIVVMRMGKGGKERFDFGSFVSELVDTSNIDGRRKELLHGGMGREYGLYTRSPTGYIEFKEVDLPKDVTKMGTRDFMGYICAFSIFLDHLSNYQPRFYILQRIPNRYPRQRLRRLGVMETDFGLLDPLEVHRFLFKAYQYDCKDYDDGMKCLPSIEEHLGNEAAKRRVIENFQRKMVDLRTGVNEYVRALQESKGQVEERMQHLFNDHL